MRVAGTRYFSDRGRSLFGETRDQTRPTDSRAGVTWSGVFQQTNQSTQRGEGHNACRHCVCLCRATNSARFRRVHVPRTSPRRDQRPARNRARHHIHEVLCAGRTGKKARRIRRQVHFHLPLTHIRAKTALQTDIALCGLAADTIQLMTAGEGQ